MTFASQRNTRMWSSVLLLGLAVVGACIKTNAIPLGPARTRAAVPMDKVVVYRTAAQVPGKYEEVALLNSASESRWNNEEKMLNSMREKAGELGANAVILDAIDEPSAVAKVAADVFHTGAERKGKAIAIFVLPDSSASAKARP
ncbi:MAG: hypothetical protein NVS4B3_20880 [Gemmatimonadaceae bacterium]